MDRDLTMSTQILKTIHMRFTSLRQIRSIKGCLTMDFLKTLGSALVLSLIDYGNMALVSLPKVATQSIQSVINTTARLITGARKYGHTTSPLPCNPLNIIRCSIQLIPLHEVTLCQCNNRHNKEVALRFFGVDATIIIFVFVLYCITGKEKEMNIKKKKKRRKMKDGKKKRRKEEEKRKGGRKEGKEKM